MKNGNIVAICYDFDKTLSPDDMQAQGYIQDVYEGDVASFWKETNELATQNQMDDNLAYMYKMVQEAQGLLKFNRQTLMEYGSRIALFPGVETWFDRINAFGATRGIQVEHYIISSGLAEMIQGTSIAHCFKEIYASAFYYEGGIAKWPAQVINYTNKTQFLFRISKGVLDVNDSRVNDRMEREDMRVPFTHMIYIGDSATDIPCMKVISDHGGCAIGVYNPHPKDGNEERAKAKVEQLLKDRRIGHYAATDYTEGSALDSLVKDFLLQI